MEGEEEKQRKRGTKSKEVNSKNQVIPNLNATFDKLEKNKQEEQSMSQWPINHRWGEKQPIFIYAK